MNIDFATAEYTGGGVYLYYGKVDGTYFLSDENSGMYLDVRPNLSRDDTFTLDWQQEHSLGHIMDIDAFNIEILDWIISHKPEGNYDPHELKLNRDTLLSIEQKFEYESGYVPELDRTVIFKVEKNGLGKTIQICVTGWYFGEPDEELTREFAEVGCVAQLM